MHGLHRLVQCTIMYVTVKFSTVHCSAVQCIAMQYRKVENIAVQYSAVYHRLPLSLELSTYMPARLARPQLSAAALERAVPIEQTNLDPWI